MRIIDGGFLSWMYGTTRLIHNGWIASKGRYSARKGNIILLDSHESLRARYYSDYKSRRKLKRDEDPEQRQKAEEVRRFKHEFIYPDPTLKFVEHSGLEADDLVACIILKALAPLPLEILGVDKDLLQLPRGSCVLRHPTHGISTIEKYAAKMPKSIAPYVTSPKDVLLSLVLYGDKSDSIPRLLQPGTSGLNLFREIRESHQPFIFGRALFGEAFDRNCYLAVLPGPWCFNPIPKDRDVPYLIESGLYHSDEQKLDESLEFRLSVAIKSVLKFETDTQEDQVIEDW